MRGLLVGLAVSLMFAVSAHGQEAAPDTSAIEIAHAAWEAKANKKNRKAFDAALEVYAGPPTTATVKAHLARFSHDASNSTASKLKRSAKAAANHLEPVADVLPQHYADSRMVAAIADFNHVQARDARIEMAHIEGWLRKWRKTKGDDAKDELREPLLKLEYRAMAWGYAMDAYYASTPKRGPSRDDIKAIRALYKVPGYPTEDESRDLPFCEGKLVQEPPVRYKGKQARNYKFGAVVARFDVEKGKVANLEIMASVPRPEFDKNAMKAISQWYWEAAKSETPGESCSMDRANLIQPVVFSMQR